LLSLLRRARARGSAPCRCASTAAIIASQLAEQLTERPSPCPESLLVFTDDACGALAGVVGQALQYQNLAGRDDRAAREDPLSPGVITLAVIGLARSRRLSPR